jgi:hypothetical protein
MSWHTSVAASVVVAGFGLSSLATPGWSQSASSEQPITGLSMTTMEHVEGRIAGFDKAARTVSVTLSNGRTVSGKVSEAVGGLDLINVGDRVDTVVEETMSFVLSGPNTATPDSRFVGEIRTSGPTQLPGGAISGRAVATWLVVGTNLADNTIALVETTGGQVHTFRVRSPEGQAALRRVKTGDKLTVVDATFVFAGVTRRN